ncbi:MAG: hypothetical protein M3Q24_01395 [bacterium]|nr:hypothetical protein [bacterium]
MKNEQFVVKKLSDYNLENNTEIKWEDFINFLVDAKSKNLDKNKRIINNLIIDCLEYKYLEKNDNQNLYVTTQGRDFITKLGFIEEYLKRRKRTLVGIGFGILGYAVGLMN